MDPASMGPPPSPKASTYSSMRHLPKTICYGSPKPPPYFGSLYPLAFYESNAIDIKGRWRLRKLILPAARVASEWVFNWLSWKMPDSSRSAGILYLLDDWVHCWRALRPWNVGSRRFDETSGGKGKLEHTDSVCLVLSCLVHTANWRC